ncbi:MAG: hypothetical protein ACOC8D_00930, partial [bacterium]
MGLLAACLLALLAPAARPEGDPAQFLEQLRQRQQAQAKAEAQEFGRLVHQARLLLRQRAYDQARTLLSRAQALRPGDETCKRLLAEIDVATATPERSDTVLDAVRDDRAARSRTRCRLLEHDLFNAQRALKQDDLTEARQHAERVVTGARYLADEARAADLRARAQKVLDAATEGLAEARTRKQWRELAASRRRAEDEQRQHLNALCDRGWRLHESGQLDEALAVAEKMLKLQPGNRKAVFLRQQTQQAIEQREDPETLRAERETRRAQTLIQQLNEEMTPPEDIHAKVVLRGDDDPARTAAAPLERSMKPWEQRIRSKLTEPVTVQFERASVSDACAHLAQIVDCPILVDPEAAAQASQFSLPKMTVSFEHVLRWLCRFNKLTYTIRDHAILVTTRGGGRLNRPVTRDYDVSGLLAPTRAIKATFEGGVQTEGGALTPVMKPKLLESEEGKSKLAKDVVGEGWVDFVRATVAPETWGQPAQGAVLQEAPRYTIRYRNGRIVVVHTPEVQREIEQMLNNFRRARNLQVHVLARFLQLEMDYLVNLDIDWGQLGAEGAFAPPGFASDPDPPGAGFTPDTDRWDLTGVVINESEVAGVEEGLTATGGLQLSYSYLTDDEVHAFLQAVAKHRKGTLLIAPRLTCFNTQRANFQAVTNFNYV